jgi:hypothetical protein
MDQTSRRFARRPMQELTRQTDRGQRRYIGLRNRMLNPGINNDHRNTGEARNDVDEQLDD